MTTVPSFIISEQSGKTGAKASNGGTICNLHRSTRKHHRGARAGVQIQMVGVHSHRPREENRSPHSNSFPQHKVLTPDASVIRARTSPWSLPVICMLSSSGSTASQWATYQRTWRHTFHGPTGFYFRSSSVIKEAEDY